jgi:hypothetical protein
MICGELLTFDVAMASRNGGYSRPTLAVFPYRHSQTQRYYLDLRVFKQGRKFFTTKAEPKAERKRDFPVAAGTRQSDSGRRQASGA